MRRVSGTTFADEAAHPRILIVRARSSLRSEQRHHIDHHALTAKVNGDSRGARTDWTKVLARLVGVVKSSAPWKTKTGTAKSSPRAFAVSTPRCARLRDQALGAQHLPVEPVADIVRSVVGGIEREADHGRDEEIGALEQIRPLALDGVSAAIGVRRCTNVFPLAADARLPETHRLLEPCGVGHTIGCLR